MPKKSIWALITTFERGEGGGGEPPRPDNELPPIPAHPIVIPPGTLPGIDLPIYIPIYPDNSLPGEQPGIDNTLPGEQPGIDNELPRPPLAGLIPTPPIYIPPEIWPKPPTKPIPPIVIPPEGPPEIDNTLPPEPPQVTPPIFFPPLPDLPSIPEGSALVLVKQPGQEPVWAIVQADGGLKPNPWPEPKSGGRGRKKK